MKAFGSNPDSPSLGKMEGGSRYEGKRTKGFSFGRIVGDPFALATISIAILAWLIAFVSSIITDVGTYYPRFAWWALVYMLFLIIGIMVAVGSDSVYTYHVAITGFLAAGLLLTSSAVDNLVYSPDGAAEASAAGFILLSMVAIVWIFYFGSQPQASHRAFVDSFALGKGDRDLNSTRSSRPMSNNYMGQPNAPQGSQPQQQMYNSQLNGFETSSPITGYGSNSQQARDSQSRYTNSAIPSQALNGQQMSNVPISGNPDNDVSGPADYPYRAKAIYSYEANPEDANEISFQKHEILEVSDVSGRWWQAKKATGETGIAPSNYLILL